MTGRFPRHSWRGHIEADLYLPPRHPLLLFPRHSWRGHIEAASNEPQLPARSQFPRHSWRGHIEAPHNQVTVVFDAFYFRAIRGAVTLKHMAVDHGINGEHDFRAIRGAVTLKLGNSAHCSGNNGLFPRHSWRGHIEASR